jgi:hypothetical protein
VNEWSDRRRRCYVCSKQKLKRRTSIPSARLKPVIAVIKRLQIYALARTPTVIGSAPFIISI